MYQITFANPFGSEVQLNVRSGSSSCELNAERYNGSLEPGGAYTLYTEDNVVCYRRTSNPGVPGSGFTTWNTFSPDDINTPTTINL